jgi:hypothetical protein
MRRTANPLRNVRFAGASGSSGSHVGTQACSEHPHHEQLNVDCSECRCAQKPLPGSDDKLESTRRLSMPPSIQQTSATSAAE